MRGEGAVAELAVFKGRLDERDMERVERYLMERHGIEPNTTSSAAAASSPSMTEAHLEDEHSRQAHALIAQPPPYKVRGDPVPLRAAARHPSVAWHRTCEVTGMNIDVSRIGSKVSKGSSDW
uniref:Uncharacterized protein n=1 Tax=Odontella aurita TaxID=265563 RepID=A0A6U6EXI8_9STRA